MIAEASVLLRRPADAVWEAVEKASGIGVGTDRKATSIAQLTRRSPLRLFRRRAGSRRCSARTNDALRERSDRRGPSRGGGAPPSLHLTDRSAHLDRAGAIAEEFLRREQIWSRDPGLDSFAVVLHGPPSMLKALERAGRISGAELEARRTGVESTIGKRRGVAVRGAVPLGLRLRHDGRYAGGCRARACASLCRNTNPSSSSASSFSLDGAVGRIALLGGRLERAHTDPA